MTDEDPARMIGDRQAGTVAGPLQRLHLRSRMIKAEELDITHLMVANNPANSSLKEDALLEANANGLTIFHLQRLRKLAKATRKVKAEDVRVAEAEVVHKAKADRSPQTADGDETTAKRKRRRVTSRGRDQVQSRDRTRQTKGGVPDLIHPRKMGNGGVRKAKRKGLRRASCTCVNQNGFPTAYSSLFLVLPNKNIQIPKKMRCRRWNIIVVNPRLDMLPLRAA